MLALAPNTMHLTHKCVWCLLAVFGQCVKASTIGTIGNLQWVSGGWKLSLSMHYPVAPGPKTLVVAGFGNCAVQMADAWKRHLFEAEAAPTGNCDTWQPTHTTMWDNQWHFGGNSLQPTQADLPLLQPDLYGFAELPSPSSGSNRIYLELNSTRHATWQTALVADTLMEWQVSSSYAQLAECHRVGGNPAMVVANTQGKTTYTFGVYLLQIRKNPDTEGVLTECTQRQFMHSVGQTVAASWGGFTPTGEPTETALGMRASYTLNLQMTQEEGALLLQSSVLMQALEAQLLEILTGLQSSDWVLDVAVGEPFLTPTARRNTLQSYSIPFIVTIYMASGNIATGNTGTMAAVLRQLAQDSFSNTPSFATQFLQGWQQKVLAAGSNWPLSTVQLVSPPFVILPPGPTPVTTQTQAPTPPTISTDADDAFIEWGRWVVIAVAAVMLMAFIIFLVVHRLNHPVSAATKFSVLVDTEL